jgi:hypothetical protein
MMGAASSLLQSIYQKHIFNKLNNKKADNLDKDKFELQIITGILLAFIFSILAVMWVKKSFSISAWHEINLMIFLLYSMPFLLVPSIFISFRTSTYNRSLVFPSAALMLTFFVSNFSNSLIFQFIMMLIFLLSVIMIGKNLHLGPKDFQSKEQLIL